jgi:RNA recognition motif-containing protein
MDEGSYEYRETTEDQKDGKYKVTTVVRVQKRQVLSNPDIERRQSLKKFGAVALLEKGKPDPTITLDDKDIYLLPFGQERNEDSIAKFVSNRTHREKMESLKQKEDKLRSGRTEDSAAKRLFTQEPTSFQIKVTNIPLWLTQQELEDFFISEGAKPRKVYRPLSREENKPRDFALLTYMNAADASTAIKKLDGKRCESQILGAEPAENKNFPGRGRGRK